MIAPQSARGSASICHTLWDGRVGAWRVWVTQYGDTKPIVTATLGEPKYRFHQTMMDDPSRANVAEWLAMLETPAGERAA